MNFSTPCIIGIPPSKINGCENIGKRIISKLFIPRILGCNDSLVAKKLR